MKGTAELTRRPSACDASLPLKITFHLVDRRLLGESVCPSPTDIASATCSAAPVRADNRRHALSKGDSADRENDLKPVGSRDVKAHVRTKGNCD